MVNFLQSIVNGIGAIVDYIVGLATAGISYISLIFESSVFLGGIVGYLPNILQICGQFVIGAAIFKAIFGRQGSS